MGECLTQAGAQSQPPLLPPPHPPVGSMAAKSGAEARAVKMPSRPSGATPME